MTSSVTRTKKKFRKNLKNESIQYWSIFFSKVAYPFSQLIDGIRQGSAKAGAGRTEVGFFQGWLEGGLGVVSLSLIVPRGPQ